MSRQAPLERRQLGSCPEVARDLRCNATMRVQKSADFAQHRVSLGVEQNILRLY